MTYRPHPKYASNDPRQGPWTSCDQCGLIWSQSSMRWETEYRGGNTPVRTGFLVCPRCVDPPSEQHKLQILPPDPPSFMNTRPENYVVDETNWMTTEDGDIIDTQDGKDFITNLPNPSSTAQPNENTVVEEAAVNLTTEDGLVIVTESGDGNPLDLEPNPPNP